MSVPVFKSDLLQLGLPYKTHFDRNINMRTKEASCAPQRIRIISKSKHNFSDNGLSALEALV